MLTEVECLLRFTFIVDLLKLFIVVGKLHYMYYNNIIVDH